MIPDDALDEFANTYREWHYLAGGFAVGWTLGLLVGARLTDQ